MATAPVTIEQLLDAISGGVADDHLELIAMTVRERKQALARRSVSGLKAGDTVTFNNSIRPRYLVGLEAEVIQVNQSTVSVRILDAEKARRFGGGPVRCPLGYIEVPS